MTRKIYITANRNRIRVKNELVIRNITHLHERLTNIVSDIANVHQEITPDNKYTNVIAREGCYILDDYHSGFHSHKCHSNNYFIIDITENRHRALIYKARFYTVKDNKKILIIMMKQYKDKKDPIINIRTSYDCYTPIVNDSLTSLILYILNNISQNIIFAIEILIDMYCEISHLVNQVNTLPVNIKSARF
jgi:hypothetical protein